VKAILSTKHGPPDVLQLTEIEKPTPRDNEVLIKIHAATVTQGDLMLRKLHPLMYITMRLFGVRRKRIPGHEFAGVVESVGAGVKRFKTGDQVFGTTTGLSVGANAEYVCLPEEWKSGVLSIKPDNISYEEATALPVGGMTALYILRKGNIQNGQRVMIYGASGSVGTYAVQLAKHHFGAEVTGVCSAVNVALVKSLGANKVIDYTKEDVTQNGQIYDVVFDAVGKLSSSQRDNLLKENGAFLTVQTTTSEESENLMTLRKLAEKGVVKAVIDRRFPLEQVAEAHRYVESGRKKGNVVISVVNQKER
jgi:NADPH:quinone reductase-like Zn-dependent oxidoreductase